MRQRFARAQRLGSGVRRLASAQPAATLQAFGQRARLGLVRRAERDVEDRGRAADAVIEAAAIPLVALGGEQEARLAGAVRGKVVDQRGQVVELVRVVADEDRDGALGLLGDVPVGHACAELAPEDAAAGVREIPGHAAQQRGLALALRRADQPDLELAGLDRPSRNSAIWPATVRGASAPAATERQELESPRSKSSSVSGSAGGTAARTAAVSSVKPRGGSPVAGLGTSSSSSSVTSSCSTSAGCGPRGTR